MHAILNAGKFVMIVCGDSLILNLLYKIAFFMIVMYRFSETYMLEPKHSSLFVNVKDVFCTFPVYK